jgi:hypothetical protein
VSPGTANPATLRYVHDVALPYATDHGIELHELRKVRRDGTVENAARPPGPARVQVTPHPRADARHRRPRHPLLEGHHWHFQESLEAIRAREQDAG